MIIAPPRRVGDGGGERHRTARALARAVLRAGGRAWLLPLLAACAGTADAPSSTLPAGGAPRIDPLRLQPLPAAAVQWTAREGRWLGRIAGDSSPRWMVGPRQEDRATRRLCGFLATGSRMAARLPAGWAMDSTLPRLLVRPVEGAQLVGVRYVTPGAEARYWFEGLSRDGRWRVSLRWPVRSDPARPIPANAPDSVFEAALTPALPVLDSVAASLALPATETAAAPLPVPSAAEAEEGAVILARDYPDQPLALSAACPQATVMLPVLARVDQRLRVPVRRGDRVVARGIATDGAVRLAFDERAGAPDAVERERLTLRTPVPTAEIVAPADGRVTLRVQLLVVPRAQPTVQPVVVTVAVNPAR